MNNETYRLQLEQKILDIIEANLKVRQMDAERAKLVAEFVLEALRPHLTLAEMHQTLQGSEVFFSELMPIVNQVEKDHEKAIRSALAEQVGALLKRGMVSQAGTVLRQIDKQPKGR